MRELLKVLALGNAVEDPAKWKRRQLLLTTISGVLTILFNLLSHYMELPFEVSAEVINNISLSLLVIGNGILTLATSKTVGLSPSAGESSP